MLTSASISDEIARLTMARTNVIATYNHSSFYRMSRVLVCTLLVKSIRLRRRIRHFNRNVKMVRLRYTSVKYCSCVRERVSKRQTLRIFVVMYSSERTPAGRNHFQFGNYSYRATSLFAFRSSYNLGYINI